MSDNYETNPGCDFDLTWLNKVNVCLAAVNERAKELVTLRVLSGDNRAAWLLKAVTCIDLTTLAGDDTHSNVSRLCYKAANPIADDLLEELGFSYAEENCPIHTAAVCVYPTKVKIAYDTISKMKGKKINIAAVAAGFPSGQFSLKTRLQEITFAVEEGANEIDIVIDRSLVLTGKWEMLYDELKQMKQACGKAHMKAILAAGELSTLGNVYKASLVAMMAGADFIKTSTGKEAVNATLSFGIVMSRAIKEFERKIGYKVGLKPAGGIKTSNDALSWLVMVKEYLGDEWLSPKLFRFGASGLLSDIEQTLYTHITGLEADPSRFRMG